MQTINTFGEVVPDDTFNSVYDIISQPTKLQQKQSKLQQRTAEKSAKFTPDTLLGMEDSDSFRTSNLGNTRNIAPDGTWYDAVELKHGNYKYDMFGAPKATRKNYQKSDVAMTKQRAQVAMILDKPINAVTEQDMIDVGNQQQVQKLADISRTQGDDRWIAPLIRDAEQTNLTGVYEDEFGNPTRIPLNIPIGSNFQKDIGSRAGADFTNLSTGINVTQAAANDPLQNSTPGYKGKDTSKSNSDILAILDRLDKEDTTIGADNSYLGNLAKAGGAGAITTGAGIADAFITLGANIVETSANALGLEKYYTEEDAKVAKDFMNKYKDSKWADETTGYNREPSTELVDKALEAFKDGNYFSGISKAAQAGPAVFMESLAYMVTAASGAGFVAMIGSEFNDSVEAYEKNNNGEEPDVTQMARMAAVDTVKVGLERIPFMKAVKGKSAVEDTVSKVLNSVPKGKKAAFGKEVAKKIGTVGLNIGEEASQEGVQYALDYFNREYGTAEDRGFDFDEMYKAQIAGGAAGGFTGTVGAAGSTVKDIANSEVISTATDTVKKVKDSASDSIKEFRGKDTTGVADTVKEENPNLDSAEVDKAVKAYNDKEIYNGEEAVAEVKDTNRDVNVAVAKTLSDMDDKLDDVKETSEITVEEQKAFTEENKFFDEKYEKVLATIAGPLDTIADAENQGNNTTADDIRFTGRISEYTNDAVNALIKMRNKLEETSEGKTPKRLAIIDEKIARLVPMTVATNTQELRDILDNASASEKVRNVLGSSAASLADVEAVLKAIGDDSGISPKDIKLLEFKREALKGYKLVNNQKLYGGGNKPGVLQWASILSKGVNNSAAVKAIKDFVAGQASKVDAFRNTVDAWDTKYRMPWTLKGKELEDRLTELRKDAKRGPDEHYRDIFFKKDGSPRDVDGTTFHDDLNKDLGSKAAFRRYAIKAKDASDDTTATYNNKVFNDIYKINGLTLTMEKEQQGLEALAYMAKVYDTSPVAQKGNKKPQTKVKEVSVPEEVAKAPVEAEKQTTKTVAKKIAEGSKLADEDLQVQSNDSKGVEEELAKIAKSHIVMRDATALALSGTGKYSIGVKEYMINYINNKPAVRKKLQELGIDMKDC